MIYRKFGNTGINVPLLGLGAGQIGSLSISEKDSEALLNTAVDLKINLIDTARAYFASEERIGRYLSHRRSDFILSTKVGYGIPGYQDWTYDCIIAGIDEALKVFRTDYIDIVHLHSCPIETLKQGNVIDALDKVRSEGKIKAAAYSGENEALSFAVSSGRFQSIMTSVNPTDQQSINNQIPSAKNKGLGVIAKRPIANALWRFSSRPYGDYAEEYWTRWDKMNLHFNIEPEEIFLRFTAFTPGVDSSIIGTADINHLKENLEIVNKGPLPDEIYNELRSAFKHNNDNWTGLV